MIRSLAIVIVAATGLAAGADIPPTVEIAPGVSMPRINLGTCCGSEPKVGLGPWLDAGGRGIDTAYDYGKGIVPGGLQTDIRDVLAGRKDVTRDDLFITSKVPAALSIAGCYGSAESTLSKVKEDVKELNITSLDLVLLHAPCSALQGGDKANARLWQGLEQALAQGLTKAIGVSNYKTDALKALVSSSTTKPAVNQCEMSLKDHDDATIAYCQANNITYEAYNTMKGCPFSDDKLLGIAKTHNVGASQVCLRWILQRGVVMAVGTGANATTAATYAKEDLDLYGFELTAAEMDTLNAMA